WNEFFPISTPITAIVVLTCWDMACSLALAPLPSFACWQGQEHGRTIPLADMLLVGLRSGMSCGGLRYTHLVRQGPRTRSPRELCRQRGPTLLDDSHEIPGSGI